MLGYGTYWRWMARASAPNSSIPDLPVVITFVSSLVSYRGESPGSTSSQVMRRQFTCNVASLMEVLAVTLHLTLHTTTLISCISKPSIPS